MNDRDLLLQAVCSNPADDTPRLVFADWFDEHGGEAEQIRGRVIREQIERDRLADGSDEEVLAAWLATRSVHPSDWPLIDPEAIHPSLGRRLRLAHRLLNDLIEHAHNWLGDLPAPEGENWLPAIKYTFRRGFPYRVEPDTLRRFLDNADAIFRNAPITELSVSLDPDGARELVATGHLRRLTGLGVNVWQNPEAVAEVLQILGESPDVGGIRNLELEAGFPEDALLALANGRTWRRLDRLLLNLSGDAGAGGFAALAAAEHTRHIAELDMSRANYFDSTVCPVPADELGEIASGFRNLRVLTISRGVESDGAEVLAAAEGLANLRHLDVSSHQIYDSRAAAALITSPKLANLVVLDLGGASFGRHVSLAGLGDALAEVPARGPTLRALNLQLAMLEPGDIEGVVQNPALRGLLYLNLSENSIGTPGAKAIAATPWERLSLLDLNHGKIGTAGVEALASSPHLAELRYLNLWTNPVGAKGGRALAASATLQKLKRLALAESKAKGAAPQLKERFGEGVSFR